MAVSGPDGYTLALTVTDQAPDKILLALDLNSAHGSAAPTVVVQPGKPATIAVGDMGLELVVNRSGG